MLCFSSEKSTEILIVLMQQPVKRSAARDGTAVPRRCKRSLLQPCDYYLAAAIARSRGVVTDTYRTDASAKWSFTGAPIQVASSSSLEMRQC